MCSGANQTEIKCMKICDSHCNISLHITKTIVFPIPPIWKNLQIQSGCKHLRQGMHMPPPSDRCEHRWNKCVIWTVT